MEDFEENMELEEVDEMEEIDADVKRLMDETKTMLTGNQGSIGSGETLALNIILRIIEKCNLINSKGEMNSIVTYPNSYLKVSYVCPGEKCAVTAGSLKSDLPIVVYSGDGSSRKDMKNIMSEAEKESNILYVCYNNQSSSDYVESIAYPLSQSLKYTATASLSHMGDFIRKVLKASKLNGVRYIEILTPSPQRWGFDSSLTIDMCRLAVESKLWPLYEVSNGKIKMNALPSSFSSSSFFAGQKRFAKLNEEEMSLIVSRAEKIWNRLKN